MDLYQGLIFVVAGIALGLLIYEIVWRTPTGSSGEGSPAVASAEGYGRRLTWKLDESRATEIISNHALGQLQLHRELGGSLESKDHVIVLAKEFLDDDILFLDASRNISKGISYFYILDPMSARRFVTFLTKLYETQYPSAVNEHITVLFVRHQLSHNNFVLLAYGGPRQAAFSAMIYDELPFAWVKQNASRARDMYASVKVLIANVALRQAGILLKEDSVNYIHVEDQVMDYRYLATQLINDPLFDRDPENAVFDLEETLAHVHISSLSFPLAQRLEQKMLQIGHKG